MKTILEQQLKSQKTVESLSKETRILQLAAALQRNKAIDQEKEINEDGDRIEEQLKNLNKTLTDLNSKNGENLNSNVIKMFKELQKHSGFLKGIEGLSKDATPAKPTVGEKIGNFVNAAKNVPKTLLQATNFFGINNKRIAKIDFMKEQKALRPDASKKEIAQNFEGAYAAKQDIKAADKKIEKLREATGGKYSDDQLMRSSDQNAALFSQKKSALAEYSKFDYGSPLVNDDDVVPASKIGNSKEAELESDRETDEQTDLLMKIEENTRPGDKQEKKEQEKSESGLFSSLIGALSSFKNVLGGVMGKAKGLAVSALKTAGKFAMAKPGLAAGLTVGAAAAYGGYKKYGEASQLQEQKVKEIDEKVASGEISPEKAEKLKQEAVSEGTVGKSGAVGEGVGGTGGALAGAAGGAIAGAKIGTLFGPVGTAIGGLIGAGVGAVSGSEVGKDIGGAVGAGVGKLKNFVTGKVKEISPAVKPSSAAAVSQKSGEVETAKMQAMSAEKPASTTVVAPKTTVNNNSTTTTIKSPIRNQESTQREYFKGRYAY